MSMTNPLTPAGIEPATFRFVAQHPNHCATAVPTLGMSSQKLTPPPPKKKTRDFTCVIRGTLADTFENSAYSNLMCILIYF